jgi:hypothetical protein
MKHGRNHSPKVGYESEHRHYSLNDLIGLLENSAFQHQYEVDRVFRGGLFWYALSSNLYEAISIVAGTGFASWLLRPLGKLSDWDYFIGYGRFSYCIGIRVKKRMGAA